MIDRFLWSIHISNILFSPEIILGPWTLEIILAKYLANAHIWKWSAHIVFTLLLSYKHSLELIASIWLLISQQNVQSISTFRYPSHWYPSKLVRKSNGSVSHYDKWLEKIFYPRTFFFIIEIYPSENNFKM